MIIDGHKYTFVVQVKEIINVNASRVIATVRIDGKDDDFVKALDKLAANRDIIKQISIGTMDLSEAPIMESSNESETK